MENVGNFQKTLLLEYYLFHEIVNMLPMNHTNEWEDHGMNDDDEIMILKIYIYIYITCALYEQDDETMIHLHECMFYMHHIKFNPTAP